MLLLLIGGSALACQFDNERLYCTEQGPFMLRKEGHTLAGFYSLLTSGHLGTVIGQLDSRVMTGRWREHDREGDLVIRFAPDFSAFEVELGPADGEAGPERRLRGALRYADGGSSFTLDDVAYRCE